MMCQKSLFGHAESEIRHRGISDMIVIEKMKGKERDDG